jgi:hypothetical protein
MFKKIVIFIFIFGAGCIVFKLFYRGYAEAYVQEISFPLSGNLSATFETKLSTEYKIVIGLKPSEGLYKSNGLTTGGDAYERSENLGRYVLEGVKVKLDGLTNSDTRFKETFSIFGGAPAYENTALEWDPQSSYLLANFQGKAGHRYRLMLIQQPITNIPNKPIVPAYLMVRQVNDWSNYLTYGVFYIAITILVLTIVVKSISYLLRIINRLINRLLNRLSSGTS